MSSILDFLLSQQGLGLGLTAAGGLLDKEPGEVLQARQVLRNQAVSPADPFARGGLYEQSLPVIQRNEADLLGGLQGRYNAAFPASLGMQGSATEALRRATGELAQNRNLFAAGLNQNVNDEQYRAASALLNYTRPDPFASSLANLGTILALTGRQGGGKPGSGSGDTAIDAFLGQLGKGATDFFGQLGKGATAAAAGVATDFLGQLGKGATAAAPYLLPAAAGGATGYFAAPALTNFANSDSPWRWLNPAAAGAESLGANDTWLSGITGAQSGAAAGFVSSGFNPIGAAIGAITGTIGGLTAQHKKSLAIKAAFRSQDNDSQRDQVFEIGNVGSGFLQELGGDQATMNQWETYVNGLAATSESPADEQELAAERLGQLIQQVSGKAPDQIPGLRQRFIESLLSSTFTAGNSSFSGGAPADLIPKWATAARLA